MPGRVVWPAQADAVDVRGPGRSPEKRKVGGSTPPLTTTYRSVPSALTSANTLPSSFMPAVSV